MEGCGEARRGKARQARRGKVRRGVAWSGGVWYGTAGMENAKGREMQMVYKFKPGARIKADPQKAGAVLEQLEAENRLTAADLVEVSRPKSAPLHKEFEWNNTKAAAAYREIQARHIINSIEIIRDEREPIRAYFNIVRTDPQYRHIDTIMQQADERAALLNMALRELEAFRRKYAQLVELAAVFEAIDAAALPSRAETGEGIALQ